MLQLQALRNMANPREERSLAQRKQRQAQTQTVETAQVLSSIARAKQDLEIANQNFSYATEPLLVDMYSYEIKAAQAKYRYLLGQARALGLEQREYIEKALLGKVTEL